MDRSMPYFVIALIGIAAIVYLLIFDHKRMRIQRLRVKKLYASPIYDAMRPMLRQARKYAIESLTIDKTGFTLQFLNPFGHELTFTMADYGYPNLTIEKQEALLLLLEEVVPKLTVHNCYSFRSKRIRMLDGRVEYQYRYIIQIDYKNMLIRAPYYDGSLQSQMW